MNITNISSCSEMKFITYGLKFDSRKFRSIQNNLGFNKPIGGLWGSPKNSFYGFKEFCEESEWAPSENFFEIKTEWGLDNSAKILTIDTIADLAEMESKYVKINIRNPFIYYIDFEEMSKHLDGIFLTERGQWATRNPVLQEEYFCPVDLYGWDCESIIVFNKNAIKIVK